MDMLKGMYMIFYPVKYVSNSIRLQIQRKFDSRLQLRSSPRQRRQINTQL